MSLFLKYRPQTFADLVGQTAIRRTLQNALKAERPSHAYLFTGSRGTGKTSTARIFAKGLNCQNLNDGDPCGTCQICTGTADGSLVDVIEIDAASNRGIDEIRDLREKINFAPNLAKRKVYIIDEVHMMTKEAFNALLKTLEEPPDHAFFCLATTEIHKVPETIRSRCQTFSFQRFTLEQLVDRLKYIAEKESITAETPALDLIARKAEGGLRDAISLLEQVAAETENQVSTQHTQSSLGISDSATLENLYQALHNADTQTGLEILRNLSQNGLDFRTFGHDFLGFLRERMLQQLGAPELGFTLHCIEEIETALQRLKSSPIIELPLEIAIINLTQHIDAKLSNQNSSSKNNSNPSLPAGASRRGAESESLPAKAATPQPEPKPEAPAAMAVKATTNNPSAEAPVVDDLSSEASAKDDGFVFEGDPIKKESATSLAPAEGQMEGENAKPAPAESNPNTPPPSTGENLTPSSLKAQMEALALQAGIPVFAKKSFLTCTPQVESNLITFTTDSEFHREKLDQADIKAALLGAIKAQFKVTDYQLRFVKGGTSGSTATSQNTASADDFLNF